MVDRNGDRLIVGNIIRVARKDGKVVDYAVNAKRDDDVYYGTVPDPEMWLQRVNRCSLGKQHLPVDSFPSESIEIIWHGLGQRFKYW